jgi:hypothetical protein
LALQFNTVLQALVRELSKKGKKRHLDYKEKCKTLFNRDMIFYVENPESTKTIRINELLETRSIYRNFTTHNSKMISRKLHL